MNTKDADQTARIRRLICAFVVRIWHKQVFSRCGSNILLFTLYAKERSKPNTIKTVTAITVIVKTSQGMIEENHSYRWTYITVFDAETNDFGDYDIN